MKNIFLLTISLFIFNFPNAQKDTNTLDAYLIDVHISFQILGGDTIYDLANIQEQPIFPGGWDKLFEYLKK